MAVRRSYRKSDNVYTVSYTGMRGVDFSAVGGNAKRYRFSYLENMYKDYEGGGAEITESIPGFRKVVSLGQKIHAIYSHKNAAGEEYAVVHSGAALYRFAISKRDDTYRPPALITLKDGKSHAFVSGNDLFVLDGENIIRVNGDGVAERLGEGDAKPYVPTTYYNGEAYEQRNLLTDEFFETYVISSAQDLTAGSSGLKYEVLSVADGTCKVVGIDKRFGGVIHVPQYATIAGKQYAVAEIADRAFFENSAITKIILPDSVKRIGVLAFASCSSLLEAVIGGGTELIDTDAFLDCVSLKTVYFGAALKTVKSAAFLHCYAMEHYYYPADENSYNQVDFYTSFNHALVEKGVSYTLTTVEIPVYTHTKLVTSVSSADKQFEFSEKTLNNEIISVFISTEDKYELDNLEITVRAIANTEKTETCAAGVSFNTYNGIEISGVDAIKGCTVCECFDGRVFLSGNKSLPNTVFYSSRDATGKNNPLYFGVFNYFNDGTGTFGVESMLAAGDSLAVFKSGDDGGGSIYYHTPKETGINVVPKIYPVSYIHSGISAVGESISFFDDPIFLSAAGVTALDKKAINLERSVAVRSHNVNALLLAENLKEASLAKWCGYLVILTGEHAYLADSRSVFTHSTGNSEYEWYYLSGIGMYKNGIDVFRYKYPAREGYSAHEKTDSVTDKLVAITTLANGERVYFTMENGKKYEVYPSGEKRGGTFYPATSVFSTEDNLLFFGTENGDVCIFNNDMRGVAPPSMRYAEDFDEGEYRKNYGRRIHPYYYSFIDHAPRYALKTVSDDGGFANSTKNTEKHSLTAKVRSLGGGSFVCEVGTDKRGYKEIARLPDYTLNFYELDFSAFSFSNSDYATVPIKEKEKNWVEKTVSFYSNEFSSPFGICSITYRFTLKGKVKY